MKNDISNLYWPGLYNVKFVHNCSGGILVMLVARSRSDKYTNFRPAGCHCEPKIVSVFAVKSYIRHKQLFNCLDRKSK